MPAGNSWSNLFILETSIIMSAPVASGFPPSTLFTSLLLGTSELPSASAGPWVRGGLVLIGLIATINKLKKHLSLDAIIKSIPGASSALSSKIDSETRAAVAEMFPQSMHTASEACIPAKGEDYAKLIARLSEWQKEFEPKHDRVFGYMYDPANSKYEEMISEVYTMFLHENGLNPGAFPVLRKLEVEVIQMTLNLFHAPKGAAGTMTSGGTESLLCAIKTYRDRARDLYPHIKHPEIIVCKSVHVAVPKACKYFDVTPIYVPFDPVTMRMDVAATKTAISANTILIVASAPQYPHGVVDPIEELAQLGMEKNIPLHVDACMGGFMLPWVERLGYTVPKWDYRVPGVTSISADLHKYGYAAKGASTITYRASSIRRYQFFAFAGWPGGMFVSPSLLGTRPGGSIACAYAALVGTGAAGYMERAKELMDTTIAFRRGIDNLPEMRVLGNPHMSIVSFTTREGLEKTINVFAVADRMKEKHDFKVECQQNPSCLHVTLTPPHRGIVVEFLSALRESLEYVRAHPEKVKEGNAATYGMVASIPSDAIVDQFLVAYLDKVLKPAQ